MIVASTDGLDRVDTVLDVRSKNCASMDSEVACNNDASPTSSSSKVTTSLDAGDYYLVVESRDGDAGALTAERAGVSGRGHAVHRADRLRPGPGVPHPDGRQRDGVQQARCARTASTTTATASPTTPTTRAARTRRTTTRRTTARAARCARSARRQGQRRRRQIDYPADTSCKSASGNTEACNTTEGVTELTMATTMGDTTGATETTADVRDRHGYAPDVTYELDLPEVDLADDQRRGPGFSAPDAALLGSSCKAPESTASVRLHDDDRGPARGRPVLPRGRRRDLVDGRVHDHRVGHDPERRQSCESRSRSRAPVVRRGYAARARRARARASRRSAATAR